VIDARILTLVGEIRDAHARTCALNEAYNQAGMADTRRVVEACRGRPDNGIPELNYFETIFDRQAALKAALEMPTIRTRRKVAGFVGWLGVMWIVWETLGSGLGLPAAFAGCVVMAGAMFLVDARALLYRDLLRRNLREQLVAQGVRLCLPCGYDLRGSHGPRCPECGAAIPRDRCGTAVHGGGDTCQASG
jgi:hypothetical protein